jgi:hypothetical protein
LVVWETDATNLVAGDSNAFRDVFLRDRTGATTTRVSVPNSGFQATGGDSFFPVISADGRVVAFHSTATNLVAGDSNGFLDVFVRDRQGATTTRASVPQSGAQASGGSSAAPALSADARFVAFESSATNLVSGDSNGQRDIFVRDRGAFSARTRVTISLASKRIPARGPLRVRVKNANGFAVFVRLSGRNGRVKLRTKSFNVAGKARKTVKLRLPRVLRRVLKRKRKLSLRMTAKVTGPAGKTRTVKKKLTPRLKKQRRR